MSEFESILYQGEEVSNTERRFGSQLHYYPVMIQSSSSGAQTPALFTRSQVNAAVARAARNPEDIPKDESFWDSLFN